LFFYFICKEIRWRPSMDRELVSGMEPGHKHDSYFWVR